MLKALAQGNKGDAGFDELKLNTTTGEVYGSVWVRSKHRTFGITLYDWTVRGEFRVNPNGNVQGHLDLGRNV